MIDHDLPAGYRDTLLFRVCGSVEEYRAELGRIAERRKRDRGIRLPRSVYDCRVNPDGSPAESRSVVLTPQVGHVRGPGTPPPSPTDLARLKQLVIDHPEAVREILAPVILDILEAYLQGDPNELAEEGQGTQG